MIRVLNVVGKMHRAGQETIIMNIYRQLDRTQLQFDFLVHTFDKCEYDDEVLSLGGRIFHIRKVTQGVVRYVLGIRKIVRENHYDIVHLHTAHSAGFLVLLGAKLGGARVRIAHSRNNMASPAWLHRLLRPLIVALSTDRFACSDPAGKWMFGKADYRVLANAIDTQKFRFSEERRSRTRAALGLADERTLGHIGRFNVQKNHVFLLEICAAVKARCPDFKMLLVGNGELMEDMKRRTAEKQLSENVVFLGSRADVPDLLSAMDVFVFPSLFEGFGNVVIEAQASGVPCVVADTLTRSTRVTDRIEYLPLGDADAWAEHILGCRGARRETAFEQVAQAGYDVVQEAREYTQIYLEAASR